MFDLSEMVACEVAKRGSCLRKQIKGLKRHLRVSVTEIAAVAGYSRSSWLRSVNSGTVKIEALFRLSIHYKLPMSYWFSEEGIGVIFLPMPSTEKKLDMAPATEEVVKLMKLLSACDKHAVLVRARQLSSKASL